MEFTKEEILDYRDEMYHTQAIEEDLELDTIIQNDMSFIWDEKDGQDGMYESFPITFTRDSIEKEYDSHSDYLNTDYHCKVRVIRSYALASNGGVAIIEYRTYTHYADMTNIIPSAQDSYESRQQIVTLGEDDGYHFLNGRRMYEDCYFNNINDFTFLIKMAIKGFDEYKEK